MQTTKYRLVWEIEIEAETPQEAAEQALEVMRDENARETALKVYSDGREEPLIVDATQPGEN